MNTQTYKQNPNRLLVEVGFAGAQYGLFQPTMAIARYLGNQEKTRAPSMLMMGLLMISMGNHKGATDIFQAVLDTELFKVYHAQAKEFLDLVKQVAAQPAKTA